MTSDSEAASASLMPPSAQRRRARRGPWVFVRDLLIVILVAVLVSAMVKAFLVRSFYIPSGSMENTLQINDRILVDELTPTWTGYQRGDVVVFEDPGGWLPVTPVIVSSPIAEGVDWLLSQVGLSVSDSEDHLVKRVIGVAGDHVVCCNAIGQLTVNGVPLEEPYIKLAEGQTSADPYEFDIVVPDDSLWVMGDNRDHSRDSRYNQDQPTNGFVPVDNVVGRAFLITWPLDRFGVISSYPEVFAGVPDPDTAE
ncbi:hypothetical protein GCM10009808_05520 [Microbacterium sediminicola]|uniref:Signal peptidase I n=1 Tax=Microbacterium sediminicola TaxID=415210 RepID=A0ABN2HPQ9_9MICO